MRPKNISTNKLIFKEFRNGNQKAFRKLFELFWEPMFVKAKVVVKNEAVAQDIVQNIWLNLWQKREDLEIDNFEAYIFKAVNNGCFKHLRDNKFHASQIEVIESLQMATESSIENQHDLEQIEVAIENILNRLSPRCQQIFRLSRLDETSNEEIAFRLGISKRSVENQVSIALKYIKKNLTMTRLSVSIFFLSYL